MKRLMIDIRVAEDKLGTAIKSEGYDRNKISHQLEILGIIDNLKNIIQERINKLIDVSK